MTGIVTPTATITNERPTLTIISVRFLGARVYARFRICDDVAKNLTILATDARPGGPRRPGGSQHGSPRIRAAPTPQLGTGDAFPRRGAVHVTLHARDTSGLTSAPARRTFVR